MLIWFSSSYKPMVQGEGFEPPKAEPSDLQSDVFDRFTTPAKTPQKLKFLWGPQSWSRRRDSNPRPAVYKTAALATELRRQQNNRCKFTKTEVK